MRSKVFLDNVFNWTKCTVERDVRQVLEPEVPFLRSRKEAVKCQSNARSYEQLGFVKRVQEQCLALHTSFLDFSPSLGTPIILLWLCSMSPPQGWWELQSHSCPTPARLCVLLSLDKDRFSFSAWSPWVFPTSLGAGSGRGNLLSLPALLLSPAETAPPSNAAWLARPGQVQFWSNPCPKSAGDSSNGWQDRKRIGW